MVVKLAEESGAAVPRHHSPFPARHGAHGGILFPDCKRSLVSNLFLCVRARTRARTHTTTVALFPSPGARTHTLRIH